MRQLLALGIVLALLLVLAGCDALVGTVEGVSLRQLYEEATANLARYDSEYKGKWYQVTGTVSHLWEYKVVMYETGETTVHGVLADLPHSDQSPLSKGDSIAARCKIGEVVGYGVFMENCSLSDASATLP